MGKKRPTTRTVNVTEAQRQLPALIDALAHENGRIVIERDGVPAGAIVSPKDLNRLRLLDEQTAERLDRLKKVRAAFVDVPPEELEREIQKALAEVREEMRQEARSIAEP